MIDLENDIYDHVENAVISAHPGCDISGEYTDTPASFPSVTIVEADNRVLMRMRTENIENAVQSMFEVNVYSNKKPGRKAEAKAIADTVDGAFSEIGYTRTFREQIPNLKDATIYRIVCRYEAVIDKNYLIYQSE